MFMNRYDIEEAVEILSRRRPDLAPYARYLDAWREVVDGNSDGWGTWGAGTGAGRRLGGVLRTAVEVVRGFKPAEEMPREAAFRAAMTPIKQFATKKGLPQPAFVPGEAPEAEEAPAPGRR